MYFVIHCFWLSPSSQKVLGCLVIAPCLFKICCVITSCVKSPFLVSVSYLSCFMSVWFMLSTLCHVCVPSCFLVIMKVLFLCSMCLVSHPLWCHYDLLGQLSPHVFPLPLIAPCVHLACVFPFSHPQVVCVFTLHITSELNRSRFCSDYVHVSVPLFTVSHIHQCRIVFISQFHSQS